MCRKYGHEAVAIAVMRLFFNSPEEEEEEEEGASINNTIFRIEQQQQ
jgi:hypothetical protein